MRVGKLKINIKEWEIMEFYDVMKNRRTVREWSDKNVTEESIKRIIEAGLAHRNEASFA